MKRTLLQVTQEYLDATSGFYVDSIFDTDESQQVAKIAERVYYQMVQEYDNVLFTMDELTLESLADTTRPNYMLLPERVQKIQRSKIWYNVSKEAGELDYKLVGYLPPLDFIEYTLHSNKTNYYNFLIKLCCHPELNVDTKEMIKNCKTYLILSNIH